MMSGVNQRITGLDVSRAIAVLGMVFVNFKIVIGYEFEGILSWFYSHFVEGRAVAVFVILAGIGLTLNLKSDDLGDENRLRKKQQNIVRRSLFLFILGVMFCPFWPADILHFYGIYFLIGAWLLGRSEKVLWGFISFFLIGFLIYFLTADYEASWDLKNLEYIDFWTAEGFFRNLFFDGFHPVFPWMTFFLLGMILGGRNLRDTSVRRRISKVALICFGVSLLLTSIVDVYFRSVLSPELYDKYYVLMLPSPLPPLPQYFVEAGGFAVFLICQIIGWCQEAEQSPIVRLLKVGGKTALTLYVAHIFFGILPLYLFGDPNFYLLLASTLLCFGLSLFSSKMWLKNFRQGPLEAICNKLTH